MAILILIEMLFLHCFADYQLHGILESMKQKEWWIKQAPNQSEFDQSMYKNDYKAALIVHSFEWSFVVLFPMFYLSTKSNTVYSIFACITLLVTNTYFHYIVDDSKANKKTLNLVEDQILHLGQILFSWLLWTVLIGWR